MIVTRQPRHTGGCQCGAVRYTLYAEPTNPHACHCRMCQKAFGNFFAPLAGVPPSDFAWLRGTPGIFKSSEAAERGFCRDCGTPPLLPLSRAQLHLDFAGRPRPSLARSPRQAMRASRADWRSWPR